MPSAALLALTILLSTAQNLFCKLFTVKYPGKSTDAAAVYAFATGSVTAVLTLAKSGFSLTCSALTLCLGLAASVFGVLLDYSLVKIARSGPYSLQMLFIINGGIIIPALVSAALGDRYSAIKWIALAAIIPAVYLACRKNGDTFADRKTFFLFCALGAAGNGGFLSMLDIQQRLTGEKEKSAMLVISYLFVALAAAVFLAATHKKKSTEAFSMPKRPLLFLVLGALALSAAINLKVSLLPVLGSVLLFAFDNVGTLILCIAFSIVLFKEKITASKVLGCALLSGALVLVAVF